MRPALTRTLPVALPLVSLLSLAAGVTGCGPASPGPRITPAAGPDAGSGAPREGTIMFDCTPADALIVVDGTPRGTSEEISRSGGLSVPLGLHRFEITRAGYRPYRIELNVGERAERLRVGLEPASP